MIRMSKRFVDRAKGNLRRYQKVLESARTRDVNESDTAVIVSDILTDVLGYDKYEEVTTEFCIRSTFCDLAIKMGGRPRYLIEVKSIGSDLKENHLNQATAYGAREGVEWVLLTNGVRWQAYRLRFEQPIQADVVFDIDLLDPAAKPVSLLERLYLLSREANGIDEIDRFHRQKEATSRYIVAQLLLDEDVLRMLKRELRKLSPGLRVSEGELAELLRAEILKRDVLEGDKATAAEKAVKRAARRRPRAAVVPNEPATQAPEGQASQHEVSV